MLNAPNGHWATAVFLINEMAKYKNHKETTIEILNNFKYFFREGNNKEYIRIIEDTKNKVLAKLKK